METGFNYWIMGKSIEIVFERKFLYCYQIIWATYPLNWLFYGSFSFLVLVAFQNCKKEPVECQCSPASETKQKFLTDVKAVNVVPHSLVPTFPESENSIFSEKTSH